MQQPHPGDGLGVPVAPWVVAQVTLGAGGDPVAVQQILGALSDAQRRGQAMLPEILPMVAATAQAVEPLLEPLTEAERFTLVIASVSVVDRIDVLAAAAGAGDDVAELPSLPQFLHSSLGRFWLHDARVRSVVHATAPMSVRIAAHRALADAHRSTGNDALAAWHDALASMSGEIAEADRLVQLAEHLLAMGEGAAAYRVGLELAHRTGGQLRARAHLITGSAALSCGAVTDAVEHLRLAERLGDQVVGARALAPLIHASTLANGYVPFELLDRARALLKHGQAPGDDPAGVHEARRWVGQALALAGCLSATTGGTRMAVELLAEAAAVEGPPAPGGRSSTSHYRDIGSALVLSTCPYPGYGAGQIAGGATDPQARLSSALWAMRAGDYAWAAATLTSALADSARPAVGLGWRIDGPVTESALTRAYVVLALAVAHLGAGNLAAARSVLDANGASLPLALPVGGMAANVSRRVDLFISGVPGRLTESLEALTVYCVTGAGQRDSLTDRAIRMALLGQHFDAATLLDLAGEREVATAASVATLPGIDAVEEWSLAGHRRRASRHAGEVAARADVRNPVSNAALVRAQLWTVDHSQLEEALSRAAEAAATLESGLERARLEHTMSRVLARADAPGRSRFHLLRAIALFTAAGAQAFADLAARELGALDELEETDTRPLLNQAAALATLTAQEGGDSQAGTPEEAGGDAQQAMTVPAEWRSLLTERERAVALLVAQGATNRMAASELFVSVRTVEVHLSSVFRKLGIRSRVELAVALHRRAG